MKRTYDTETLMGVYRAAFDIVQGLNFTLATDTLIAIMGAEDPIGTIEAARVRMNENFDRLKILIARGEAMPTETDSSEPVTH
jgi:hypothetical protein